MKNELFDKFGAYRYMEFVGDTDTWRLISTESTEDTDFRKKNLQWTDTCIGSCLDTFRSTAGIRKTINRSKVSELFDDGKITPVLSSEIKVAVDNGKTKRRAV